MGNLSMFNFLVFSVAYTLLQAMIGAFIYILLGSGITSFYGLITIIVFILVLIFGDRFVLWRAGAREIFSEKTNKIRACAAREARFLRVSVPQIYFYDANEINCFVVSSLRTGPSLAISYRAIEELSEIQLYTMIRECLKLKNKTFKLKLDTIVCSLNLYLYLQVDLLFSPIRFFNRNSKLSQNLKTIITVIIKYIWRFPDEFKIDNDPNLQAAVSKAIDSKKTESLEFDNIAHLKFIQKRIDLLSATLD